MSQYDRELSQAVTGNLLIDAVFGVIGLMVKSCDADWRRTRRAEKLYYKERGPNYFALLNEQAARAPWPSLPVDAEVATLRKAEQERFSQIPKRLNRG